MGYCTFTDIQADFKSITFNASSLVTDTAVTQFIVEAGALINSIIGGRYVTPITGDSDSLALMSLYCRTLVAARVRGILENKQTTNIDANQNVKADGFGVKEVMQSLKDIKNNEQLLSGAALRSPSGGFFSNSLGSNPKFKKNVKSW